MKKLDRAARGGGSTTEHDPRRCYLCGKRAQFRYLCHRCIEQLPNGTKHQFHQVPLDQWFKSIEKYRRAS